MGDLVLSLKNLFNTEEACVELGIGQATLYRWIKKGKIIPATINGSTFIPLGEIRRIQGNRNKQAVGGEPTA